MKIIKTLCLAALIALAACAGPQLPPHTIEDGQTADRIVLVSHDATLDHKTAQALLESYSNQVNYQVVLKKPAPDGQLKIYAALNVKNYDDGRLIFSDVLFQ